MSDELPAWMTQGTVPVRKPAQEEIIPADDTVSPLPESEDVREIASASPKPADPLAGLKATMRRDIRSWGKWLIGLGVVHLIASGSLDASWGVMLILLGAMSFLFTSPSMYVIYAVTMAWAGISNLVDTGLGWSVFALFQFYLTFRIGWQYHVFRKAGLVDAEREAVNASQEKPIAPRFFPWLGLVGGVLMTWGILTILVGALIIFGVYDASDESMAVQLIDFLFSVLISLVVAIWGINLAAVLSKYRPHFLAWLGLFLSSVTLILVLVLLFS